MGYNPDKILGTNPHNNSMQYNLYNELLLQFRCNDSDYTIKASTCTNSKYYSYMFHADRTKTLYDLRVHSHNIPQKLNTDKRNTNKRTNQLHLIASRRTLHNWWRISRQQVFYTARKQLNKIRKGGNSQPQNNRKRTTLSFVYFSLFISKVKPNAGWRMVIRSRYKVKGYSLVYQGQTYFYLYI